MFSKGLIDLPRTRVFDQQLGHLSDQTVDAALDRVLDAAPDLTTGQLRARLARLVMDIDPEGVDVGYVEGLANRKFVTYANPDHTATTAIQSIAPNDSAAISARVRRLAMSLRRDSDPRTLDQISADIAVDLLMGRMDETVGSGGGVHLNVDVATLAELSDTPGELAGYGPVIADIARKTAESQASEEWTYSVTDESGDVIAAGMTGRRPTAAQRRRVEAMYQTCTFPGCRMPAYDCDLDHRKPFAQGGPTHDDNLGPLCRHHHMAKHHAPWHQERCPTETISG